MPPRQPPHAAASKRIFDDLTPLDREVEFCEQRLALSASLATDWLLELASLGDESSGANFNEPAPPENLFTQSEQLREIVQEHASAEQLPSDTRLDGSGQTIAVIDSGIAWDHVSLGAGFGPGYRVVGGWDFAENDANPYDDGPAGFHGTHVASVIGGQSEQFIGIAPESDLVALRVFDDQGAGELEWVESALQWVHENQDSFESPITTVNLSLGTALDDSNRDYATNLLADELAQLRDDGILVFAAAGNQFDVAAPSGDEMASNDILFPASSPLVVPVSSISQTGDLSDFAQRQDGILAAPGESILGAVPEHVFGWDGVVDDTALLAGTSLATPQVAAISTLVRQTFSFEGIEPTVDQILQRLDALTQEQFSQADGISYRTFDLSRLADFLPISSADSPVAEETTAPAETTPVRHPALGERLNGSHDNEILELDLRDGLEGGPQLRFNDQIYAIDQAVANSAIVIDAHGGSDTLKIYGSAETERLILHADAETSSVLTALGIDFELRGFEQVEFVGGGGSDRAILFDGEGDDTLTSHPSQARLSGVGFQFVIEEVDRIYVHATGGGNDQAFIHDSDLDDQLAVRPQFTSLRNDQNFQLAFGFERVFAYSNLAGHDSIEIRDSDGDDTLSVSAARSTIVGPGYHVTANGFDSIEANSTAGGHDVARIYADTESANWETSPDRTQWTDQEGSVRIARGFEDTETFQAGRRIELSPQSASSNQPIVKLDEEEIPWWIHQWQPLDPTADLQASQRVFEDFGNAPF